jgi:IS5 family transposase
MFDVVRQRLELRGLLLKSGWVVDATIFHASSSTKNAADTRDPEMKQGRKGKAWSMKIPNARLIDNSQGVETTEIGTCVRNARLASL